MCMGNIICGQTSADLQKTRVKDTEIIVFLFDHWVSGEIAWQHVVHGIFLMVYGIVYVTSMGPRYAAVSNPGQGV